MEKSAYKEEKTALRLIVRICLLLTQFPKYKNTSKNLLMLSLSPTVPPL